MRKRQPNFFDLAIQLALKEIPVHRGEVRHGDHAAVGVVGEARRNRPDSIVIFVKKSQLKQLSFTSMTLQTS